VRWFLAPSRRTETELDTIEPPHEIDSASVGALVHDLDRASGADVDIDCSGVTFIDSSGLRALLEAEQRLRAEDRRLVLVDPSAVVVRLLEITGTLASFEIRRTDARPDAV
jgi:anti-anti-sigma factor